MGFAGIVQLGLNMDIEDEKSRIKKWIFGYIILGFVMLAFALIHWIFLFPAVVFICINLLMFRDLRKLDKNNVQEVVSSNLDEKKLNGGTKMELSNEEKTALLETLSKDEELNLFLKVTNGQVKFAIFEKLRAEVEAKPEKKAEVVEPKAAEKGSKEEEDIVVED